MKDRRLDIDNFKGFLIYLVVFAHCLMQIGDKRTGLCYEITAFIYFFHMPLFIFSVGLTTKEKTKLENFLKYIKYYIIFNSIYAICGFVFLNQKFNPVEPYYSMWFILAVMAYRLIANYINDIKNKKMFFVLCVLTSICIQFFSFGNIFAINRIVSFFPFFLIGYFLKDNIYLNKEKVLKSKIYIIMYISVLCFCLYFIYRINKATNMPIINYTVIQYEELDDIFMRLFILFFSTIMAFVVFVLIPNKNIPIMTKFGKNSLSIYLFHRIITLILPVIFQDKYFVVFSLIASFCICLVFSDDFFIKLLEKINFKKHLHPRSLR